MALPLIAVAAVVGGSLLNTYAKYKQSNAEASALNESAELKKVQANELLKRSEINVDVIKKQASRASGGVTSIFAKSGLSSGGAGTLGLQQLEQLNQEAAVAIVNERHDAGFKAEQLFREGMLERQQAGRIRANRDLQVLGGILGATGTVLGAVK